MTKKLVWRLKEQPTSAMLRELVASKLLINDEARDILFNEIEETERDVKSLEAEIKFLRELVEKLSNGKTSTIIETIRYVEKPYIQYPWYQPYQIWCGGITGGNIHLCGGNKAMNTTHAITDSLTSGTDSLTSGTAGNCSFAAIETF